MYGGDGFWMFVDPTDPDFIYAESQGGYIGRVNRKTHESRDIKPLPGYKEGKLRFNWNAPIHISPTQKGTVYIGAQYPLPVARFRSELGSNLSGSDDERSLEAEAGGVRRRHSGQLLRRDAHDDLRHCGVPQGSERDLGRDR